MRPFWKTVGKENSEDSALRRVTKRRGTWRGDEEELVASTLPHPWWWGALTHTLKGARSAEGDANDAGRWGEQALGLPKAPRALPPPITACIF